MTQPQVPGGPVRTALALFVGLALGASLGACTGQSSVKPQGTSDPTTAALRSKVKTIVVIYAENRSFDNLYGHFPGAQGLDEVVDSRGQPLPAYAPQRDRDGSILQTLPQTWEGSPPRVQRRS